nr:helicase [Tanacetum cinerariifolium]
MPDMQHVQPIANAQNISLKLSYQKHTLMKNGTLIIIKGIIRSKAIKYLFKYLNKGPDRATIIIEENVKTGPTLATETVAELSFHLPNQKAIIVRDSKSLPALLQMKGINVTMFTDWFELNKCDPTVRTLTYTEILKNYVWYEKEKLKKLRKQRKCIGRIVYSSPASGERYYLRMLLNVVRGVQGFEELMTVNNRICHTFKEACFAYGLLNDDREWTKAISKACSWALGPQLLDIFITMLLFCDANPSSHPKGKKTRDSASLHKQVFTLTRIIKVNEYSANEELDTSKQEFNRWVLAVGDGNLPAKIKEGEDEPTWIEIPERFLIKEWDTPIQHIVAKTYLNFTSRQTEEEYLKERVILTPRNQDADAINEFMFKKFSRDDVTYDSADEICKASTDNIDQHQLYTVEFLNLLIFLDMPPHKLCLKKNYQ